MTVIDLPTRYTLGGSQAAAACGLVPQLTPLLLWHQLKTGIEREPTEAMQIGTALHDTGALDRLMSVAGYDVMPAPDEGFVHPDRPWMVVHPDGLADVDGTLGLAEYKTRGLGWQDDDPLALAAAVMQLQHGFEVTKSEVGVLGVLHGGHGGMRYHVEIVRRDEKLIRLMLEAEERLIDCLVSDRMPDPLGLPADREALLAIFEPSPGTVARADKRIEGHVREARILRESIAARKEQLAKHEQVIQAHMGEATELISRHDTTLARWTPYERTALDTAALKEALPGTFTEFSATKTLRRF